MDTALAPVFEAGEDQLDLMKTYQAAIPDTYGRPKAAAAAE